MGGKKNKLYNREYSAQHGPKARRVYSRAPVLRTSSQMVHLRPVFKSFDRMESVLLEQG